MNIIQWNFFNKFVGSIFSGVFYLGKRFAQVFCLQFLLMLSETPCMLWYKVLKYDHLDIGIWGCRLFTRPSLNRSRFCRRAKSLSYQQICLLFSKTQPTLKKYLQIPTYKTITLASTVTMFLNFVHFGYARKKNKIICKKKKKKKKRKIMFTVVFTVYLIVH